MVKCPQCGFDNEDGELFCEQCKTDLSSTAATPAEPEVPVAAILADPLQVANDPLPIVEAAPMDPLPVVSIDPIVPAPFPILGLDDPLPVASCWLTLACLLAAALWVLHRKVRACEVSR